MMLISRACTAYLELIQAELAQQICELALLALIPRNKTTILYLVAAYR